MNKIFESTEDFRIISEEEQENGDLLITFEVSEKLLNILVEKYGENWQEDFEKEFIERLKNIVDK